MNGFEFYHKTVEYINENCSYDEFELQFIMICFDYGFNLIQLNELIKAFHGDNYHYTIFDLRNTCSTIYDACIAGH